MGKVLPHVSGGGTLNLTNGTTANVTGTLAGAAGPSGGAIVVNNGIFNVGAAGAMLNVTTPGTLQFSGGTVQGSSPLTVASGSSLTESGTYNLYNNLNNQGTITQSGGYVNIGGGTTLTQGPSVPDAGRPVPSGAGDRAACPPHPVRLGAQRDAPGGVRGLPPAPSPPECR